VKSNQITDPRGDGLKDHKSRSLTLWGVIKQATGACRRVLGFRIELTSLAGVMAIVKKLDLERTKERLEIIIIKILKSVIVKSVWNKRCQDRVKEKKCLKGKLGMSLGKLRLRWLDGLNQLLFGGGRDESLKPALLQP
jgi:hypothetical protein